METEAYVPMAKKCEKQTAESWSRAAAETMETGFKWAKSVDRWKWNKDAYAGSHCLWNEIHIEFDALWVCATSLSTIMYTRVPNTLVLYCVLVP